MKSIVSAFMVTLIIVSTFTLAFNVRPVRASGTIYIRADGSIDPPTAPISSADNVTYTLTGNINDSIVVERDSIVVDGAGFTVQGTGAVDSRGIDLQIGTDVTIKNTHIENFWYGVFFYSSDNNTLSGNNIANNGYGIMLYASSNYNSISGNNVADNYNGILLEYSSNYNNIFGNNITANNNGIHVYLSSNSSIFGNNITANNYYGIEVSSSSSNRVFHNNFINNTNHVWTDSNSTWDDGYPSGGNYWSDYGGNDSDVDRIGDTPYVIDASNRDNYPLMGTFGPSTPPGENIVIFPADDVCVTYETVTLGGLTTVEKSATGPAPPPGFTVKQYYVIETTADYTGNISIKIIYDMLIGARGDRTLEEDWQLLQCVMLAGDVDEDFDVDIFDIVRLAGVYLAVKPDPRYNPLCDLDHDGDIDIFDIVRAAGNYGKTWNPATGWSDITTRVDEENNSIFGVTNHLSIFGVTVHG